MPIANASAQVTAHFQRTGSVLRGTAEGRCTGFEVVLSLDADAPLEKVRRVLEMAHATCYTESALRGEMSIAFTHKVNGEEIGGGD